MNRTQKIIRKADNAGMNFIDAPWFQIFIVISCVLCDSLTIRSIFARYIVDNILTQWIIVIVAATALDTLPVLMASYLNKYRTTNKKTNLICFAVVFAGFIGEYVLLFHLRWSTRFETLHSVNDVGMTNSIGTATTTALSDSDITAVNAIALFLSVLPLLTSILAFAVSMHESTASKRHRELLNAKRHISERIGVLYGLRAELDKPWEQELIAADEIMFESACSTARAIYNAELELFKLKLARKLKKANSISILTGTPIDPADYSSLTTYKED